MSPIKMMNLINAFFLVVLAAHPVNLWASEDPARLTARQIMEKVENRDAGDNGSSEMRMTLIDDLNRRRVRTIRSFFKESGDINYKVLFFLTPADVQGTGFLTYSYKDSGKQDEQWIHLPALQKTKRIPSTSKKESFMGSDFTYADMASKDIDDYKYAILKESDVNGTPVWLIQALPINQEVIDETGYEKSVLFVRKDNYVIARAVYWVADEPLLKYMDVKDLQLIDGVWVATETHMTTRAGRQFVHQTILELADVRFNQDLDDDLFTLHRLETGL